MDGVELRANGTIGDVRNSIPGVLHHTGGTAGRIHSQEQRGAPMDESKCVGRQLQWFSQMGHGLIKPMREWVPISHNEPSHTHLSQ